MPSTRRVRLLVFALIFVSIVVILVTSSARHSDQRFRDRTVAALNERQKHKAETEAKAAAAADEKEKAKAGPPERPKDEPSIATVTSGGGDPAKEAPVRQPPAPAETDKARPGVRKAGERWGEKGGDPPPEPRPEKSAEDAAVEAELNAILKRSPIIIFSKTYCPYSKKAKAVFAHYAITPAPFIVELDEHALGPQLQKQLEKSTGRRTVPNVLVNGVSLGGGDDIEAFHEKRELEDKIRSLAGKRIQEIKPAES